MAKEADPDILLSETTFRTLQTSEQTSIIKGATALSLWLASGFGTEITLRDVSARRAMAEEADPDILFSETTFRTLEDATSWKPPPPY